MYTYIHLHILILHVCIHTGRTYGKNCSNPSKNVSKKRKKRCDNSPATFIATFGPENQGTNEVKTKYLSFIVSM